MPSEQQIKVLLVEDSTLLAERLMELLSATPFTKALGVVATEKDAVDASFAQHPDLMILDLHLKQGTGFGVLKALAHSPKRPYVIVLTNYALPQYRDQAMALGAQYFLDKSADFDRLPTLIKDFGQQAGILRAEQPLASEI